MVHQLPRPTCPAKAGLVNKAGGGADFPEALHPSAPTRLSSNQLSVVH
jgi:hypothetical protein